MKKIMKSYTVGLDIAAEPGKVFSFMSNPSNWPKYAIVNLKSVNKTDGEWVEIETIHGKGHVKMLTDQAHGILDHIWKDPNASWQVYVRVIPNLEGSTLLNTFFKPAHYDDDTFNAAMKQLDIEFNKLKEILEGNN
jgi:hypothetical protein